MKKTFILFICICISVTSFGQKQVSLEEIWLNYEFYPSGVSGFKSMYDGEHYTTTEKGDDVIKIYKNSFETGEVVEIIMDSEDERLKRMGKYTFNKSEDKILIATNTESIYRYSTKSVYYIYNTKTKRISNLSENKVMYATFSPNGKNIAYVFENNIYIYNILLGNTKQITFDGEKNKVINGASDWVYEEEFALVRSFEWSGDSETIAYFRFDESDVKEFSMDLFKGGLYPTQEVFKYPKTGEDNSKVTLHLYDLQTKRTTDLKFEKDYEYFPRIKWFNEENPQLVIYGMNRHQNELDFIISDIKGSSYVLFTETDQYYIDVHDNLRYLTKQESFIWTSEKNGFNHIYLKYLNGNEKQITNGNWEVTNFYGIDDKDYMYYSSNESGSIHSTMYKMSLTSNLGKGSPMTKITGTNNVTFSKGMKYFMNSYSNHNTAPVYTLNRTSDREIIEVLEDNSAFNKTLSEYDLSEKEFFTIETEVGVELNAWMMKPTDFDSKKEYPLYMFLYGGPGSQQVTDSWGWFNYFWYQHLNQLGYIVVCVDNRGTGGKGAEFKKMTYQELGKYETIDQINAAKYFGSLDYIDSERIGIQGWSYGGYMSSLAITKGADVFKMAIAVAPVTNWRYYDNIYTERYMRTPQENASGYDNNSPINHVDKLKGSYLLVHGSADDNVHVQNTMEMISALVRANKQFDLFIYPDKNHGIYGGNTRYHLYKKMTDFILENL
ncbi:MAG: S9 family peptidase [Flavobacteriales bacterium]|nr:S9 family peptidase [Flavobacteriales bacterium]|tara:strand:- start:23141 stop:25303 length:2163 start_codon:yes stop_codon:yes gene_type:complete